MNLTIVAKFRQTVNLTSPRFSFSLEFYFHYYENYFQDLPKLYFHMMKTLLDETELSLLSEIGITVRRKISGDPEDYTKVKGSWRIKYRL